jgi:hypothetical protein
MHITVTVVVVVAIARPVSVVFARLCRNKNKKITINRGMAEREM